MYSYFACGPFLLEEEEVGGVVMEEDLRDVGTTGLCNGVNLEVGTLGLLVLLSVDSMEDTEGGLLSKDLSPQSILEDTLDRSSLGEALYTLPRDSAFTMTVLEPPDLPRDVCDGVLKREGGVKETLEREGVRGMSEPYCFGCGNLPNIGNLQEEMRPKT